MLDTVTNAVFWPAVITLIFIIVAFIAGSLPFSVWLGRSVLKQDITCYGDANPGATNVMRAGSKKLGILALVLDTLKALIPVAAAYYWAGVQDWRIIPIAVAPIAGHAFSPFLHWRGGKAVATTLGTWMALTIWEGPAIGGFLLWFSRGWSAPTAGPCSSCFSACCRSCSCCRHLGTCLAFLLHRSLLLASGFSTP